MPLLAALTIGIVGILVAWGRGHLPTGISLSALGLVGAAAVAVASGASTATRNNREPLFAAFCYAWIAAGACNGAIALLQVFAPDLPDGDWIAHSGLIGRAVGNLRQPNHLATLLLWSAVAIVPLLESKRLQRNIGRGLFAAFVFGLVLTGSRTGMVGVAVLTLWGVLDRRLDRHVRTLLWAAPLLFAAFWILMSWWARETSNTFGAAAHLVGADVSSSRFGIWADTLTLIARHPWAGVGFGEFNFAWSLTPFPNRPVAFFDHTHNLPLQLAVELGLPFATLMLGLLGWALWQAWRRSAIAQGATGVALRSAFVMVLMMALHSELEYPLWYAYFLLPTAWAWGCCLGSVPVKNHASALPSVRWLVIAGVTMVLASVTALADYMRVARIFAPDADAPSLAQRIEAGRRSLLFAHHADYAYVTTSDEPVIEAHAFDRAPHYLLDTRLMIAWARSYAARGDLDRARHIAQRLREFRNPASEEFFAPCAAPPPRPFQCEPPSRVIDWREFR